MLEDITKPIWTIYKFCYKPI